MHTCHTLGIEPRPHPQPTVFYFILRQTLTKLLRLGLNFKSCCLCRGTQNAGATGLLGLLGNQVAMGFRTQHSELGKRKPTAVWFKGSPAPDAPINNHGCCSHPLPLPSQEVSFSAARTVRLWLGAHQGWTPVLLGKRTSLINVSSVGRPFATRATWPVTAQCTQVGEERALALASTTVLWCHPDPICHSPCLQGKSPTIAPSVEPDLIGQPT